MFRRILVFSILLSGFQLFAQSLKQVRKEFYSSDKNLLRNAEILVDFYHDESPDSLHNVGTHLLNAGFKSENMSFVHYGKLVLSSYYTKHGKAELSLKNLEECLSYYEKQHDDEKLADLCNKMGVAYLHLNQEKQAIEWFLKSLKYADKLAPDNESYMAQINMAEAFYRLGDYASAESETDGYLKKVKKQKLNKGLRRAYEMKGKIAFAESKAREGLDFYQKSLALAIENGDKLGLSFAKNDMAIAYFQLDEKEKAKQFFLESLRLRKELNNPNTICESYFNLAQFYYAYESYDDALLYFDSVKSVAQKFSLLQEHADAVSGIAECYKKTNNFAKSLAAYEELNVLKDSLLLRSKKMDESLLGEFDNYRFKKEQLRQRLREKILEKRLLSNQKRTLKIIVIGACLVGILLYLLFKKGRPNSSYRERQD